MINIGFYYFLIKIIFTHYDENMNARYKRKMVVALLRTMLL